MERRRSSLGADDDVSLGNSLSMSGGMGYLRREGTADANGKSLPYRSKNLKHIL